MQIDLDPGANYTSLTGLTPAVYVAAAINILLGIAGVAAFIFLLIGGVRWITAGGDKDALQKAQKIVIQALIGLAVVFSAYALLYIIRVLFQINAIDITLQGLTAY